jgi:hypothetical protein
MDTSALLKLYLAGPGPGRASARWRNAVGYRKRLMPPPYVITD